MSKRAFPVLNLRSFLSRRLQHEALPAFLRLAAIAVAALAVLAVASPAAEAETWPSKPIKFIVGYPAGGGADISARLFAEHMPKTLGQPIIVENRAGGGGRIGATSVARAEPDGYTLYVAAISEISIAPATVKDMPYDPEKDFKPIALFGKWPQILVTSPSFPPNNIAELVAYLKANPGKVSYSSFGTNTLNHINGERFGVAAPERLAAAPELPTLAEAGLPNFYVSSWIGLLAPAGTPQAIVDRLNKETLAALAFARGAGGAAEGQYRAGWRHARRVRQARTRSPTTSNSRRRSGSCRSRVGFPAHQ
jgi:tripartite-type tricarboxylate transporter receptor subunit TctC